MMILDTATRMEVVEDVLRRLQASYVFPEAAQQMEQAIRARIQRQEYDGIASADELAQTLTTHLRLVRPDNHLRVRYSAEPLPIRSGNGAPQTPQEVEEYERYGRTTNFGFKRVEQLDGNIGYLRLDAFFEASLGGDTATAAMSFLAHTDALIVDVRFNGGGDPAMVALLTSYLFGSDPVHLNDFYGRLDNSIRQSWTYPYVPGKRYVGKPVYILTAKRTGSGAEEFAYNLKHLKRAILVGETTHGAANPGGFERINDHFEVFIPTGRPINAVTKTNWEGTGVRPDVDVPAETALHTAHLAALKALLDNNTDEKSKAKLRSIIEATQTRDAHESK